MNLKEYLKDKQISIKTLSNQSGIPYTTVGDIINGKTDIDNVSVKVLMGMSRALNISMNQVYEMSKNISPTPKLLDGYTLSLKKGKYYISFEDNKEFLCNNNPINAYYIKDIAETFINNKQEKERMDKWQEMFLNI